MTSGAPWSVKGIDPKAREIAKDLARRSGMTLGEWLNQVILEDGPVEAPLAGFYAAGSGMGRGSALNAGTGPASVYGRFEAAQHPSDEIYRVTEALDRLSERIEAAEHRSTLAISGIDQSVAGVVQRLAGAEREQTAVAARFEGAVDDLRMEQDRVVERLRRIEQEAAGPRSVDALRAMEGALAKVANHLYEGEARTRETLQDMRRDVDGLSERLETGPAEPSTPDLVDSVVARVAERLEQAEGRTTAAVRGLESSLAHLDDRLGAAEARLEGRASDGGLEQIAANLSASVDAARLEMAEKIRASADGRFDRMERTLQEMTGHVQAAERRSADAIERMGHEVLRMADVLSRKVQDAEHRSADAIEHVGGEVSRIANAMETRLARIDGAGAQALEKLGGEIARITERLSERIADAERRSAQAIDDVSDQMARFGDRFQDRQERTSSELADRIRQSEERTARLLEDARERIDQRLAEAQKRVSEPQPAPDYADPAVAPFGHAEPAYFGPGPGAPALQAFARADAFAAAPPFAAAEPFDVHVDPADAFAGEAAFQAADPFDAPEAFDHPALDEEARVPGFRSISQEEDSAVFDAALAEMDARTFQVAAEPAAAFDAIADDDGEPPAIEPDQPPPAPPAPQARLSTRELIEQARAAARSATDPVDGPAGRARPKSSGGSLFGAFGRGADRNGGDKKKPKRRGGTALQVALLASGTVAASSLALAGYIILADRPEGALPSRVAEGLGSADGAKAAHPLTKEVAPPLMAMALAPKPIVDQASPAVAEPAPAAPADGAPELYADGVQKIETRDPAGLEAVRKAANLGYAPAEFFLAKLYENGEAGVKKDAAEARRWTQRAADAGDRKAMHNLALYYFEGTGGGKNTTVAAQWFRRAAEAGLVDSQYNLGRLYEEGFGVAQNPAEAYKWYLIAAATGDQESRTSAKRLKSQLSIEAQAAAERAAQSFQAQATQPGGAPSAQAANSGVVNAQRALSHLGYYRGPTDGVTSPALKFAIAAFQRDKGLSVNGNLDASVSPLLDAAAR